MSAAIRLSDFSGPPLEQRLSTATPPAGPMFSVNATGRRAPFLSPGVSHHHAHRGVTRVTRTGFCNWPSSRSAIASPQAAAVESAGSRARVLAGPRPRLRNDLAQLLLGCRIAHAACGIAPRWSTTPPSVPACQRFFVAPLEMRADIPDGDIVCRLCEGSEPALHRLHTGLGSRSHRYVC